MPTITKNNKQLTKLLRNEKQETELRDLLRTYGHSLKEIKRHQKANSERSKRVFELARVLRLSERVGGASLRIGPFRRERMYAYDTDGNRFLMKRFTVISSASEKDVLKMARNMGYDDSIFSEFSMTRFGDLAREGHSKSNELLNRLVHKDIVELKDRTQILPKGKVNKKR